ncbi:MAG: SDR family NAD(P)-dependent oxidoreductase [Chloroflexota bacterium]
MTSLEGRVIIITGGGSGLGRASAGLAASQGANLVLADLDSAGLDGSADEILSAGGRVRTMTMDVRQQPDAERLTELAIAEFGRLDGMVTSAGVDTPVPAMEMTLAEWERVISINLTGTFVTSQAAARAMIQQGTPGSIVTLASGIAIRGRAAGAHYAASKAGVIGLTKSLALAVAKHQIRVNAVAPGLTDTPMARQVMSEDEMRLRTQDIPLGRFGQPDDIGNVICFLLSDASRWMTGQTLHANGGVTMP